MRKLPYTRFLHNFVKHNPENVYNIYCILMLHEQVKITVTDNVKDI